jgi:hypothetical protein
MKNPLLLLAAASALAGACPAAALAQQTPAEAGLLAAEDARFAAQVRHDAAAVAQGLGAELVYSHGNGRRQSRPEYLAALAAGQIDYRSIVASDRIVHVYGKIGVTRAILNTQVGERAMRSSVLAVYVRRGGHWQLVSWQTTALPDP